MAGAAYQQALVFVATAFGLAPGCVALDAGGCSIAHGDPAVVREVPDGETVKLDDGRVVRLIGTLAPRSPMGGKPWRIEIKARDALAALTLNRRVSLGVSGRSVDRHGQTLAHVFAEKDGVAVWVQGEMLRQGLARAYGLPGQFVCFAEMKDREQAARREGLALWKDRAFGVAAAADPKRLLRAQGSFQIVTGAVRKVERIRNRVYVNFGDDWRSDFTAGATLNARNLDKAWASKMEALTGWTVEVRGWVERRYGPFIEIWDAGQIDVIDRTESASSVEASGVRRGASDAVERENSDDRAPPAVTQP